MWVTIWWIMGDYNYVNYHEVYARAVESIRGMGQAQGNLRSGVFFKTKKMYHALSPRVGYIGETGHDRRLGPG